MVSVHPPVLVAEPNKRAPGKVIIDLDPADYARLCMVAASEDITPEAVIDAVLEPLWRDIRTNARVQDVTTPQPQN